MCLPRLRFSLRRGLHSFIQRKKVTSPVSRAFSSQVEQFWRFYSHMVRPGDLTGHSDFHLFKEGIKPMWEVRTEGLTLLL